MEIYGAKDDTEILYLNDEEYSEDSPFRRGSSDVFILALKKPLGSIRAVRIGHDNSGKRPSWFLEDVVILDKQTMDSWTFSNSQWLALERGDGRIERLLEDPRDKPNSKRDAIKLWWKGLTEEHIWVSILAKPPTDRFSRVQRASCCLSIILSAMLANAMFYELKGKSTHLIQVGPLKFSWRQVIVGIQSALIVAPINILIAFLFKKASSRSPNQHTLTSAVCKWLGFIAWFLCICTCAVSATITIFYSLEWEKEQSEQWLSSMFISFAQDLTVIEPTKVFLAAVFLAVILRRKRGKSNVYLPPVGTFQVLPKGRLWKMNISDVEGMRKRQAKKQNVSRFFVELFVYCLFIAVLMVVSYGNRNDHRYFMTKSIRDLMPQFYKVGNRNDQLYLKTKSIWDDPKRFHEV